MVSVESYLVAVVMCIVTMLCWGSWANTQKLASKEWRFQLFYWDYCIGVLVLTVVFAFTLGSMGSSGRSFLVDLGQAAAACLLLAFLSGVVFNIANILLVAAIDIAGMAVAFPIGIGLALVIGVGVSYATKSGGNPWIILIGVLCVIAAILLNSVAYRRVSSGGKTTTMGIVLSVACGVLMGFFYPLMVMAMDSAREGGGELTPYTALVFFSLGLFLSSFIFNVILMKRPFTGEPVPLGDYFRKGSVKLHTVGILGGAIWGVGMSFNIIAQEAATPAIAYGLGQGATMVAAFWGVFIWKEFKDAPAGTNRILALMFAFFIVGLGLLIYAKQLETSTPEAAMLFLGS